MNATISAEWSLLTNYVGSGFEPGWMWNVLHKEEEQLPLGAGHVASLSMLQKVLSWPFFF